MQQDERIRLLLTDAADSLGPTPDLTARALADGRRSLFLGRVRTGAVCVVAAASVLTPAVVVAPWWNDATGPAATYGGSMPLHPAAWPVDSPLEAPTTAFPVVTGNVPDEDTPELTTDQRQVQYAFKQKAAEILSHLLPGNLGSVEIVDDALNGYLLNSPQGVLHVSFRGMAIPPGIDRETSFGTACPPVDGLKNREGDCLSATLPDGTGVRVRRGGESDGAGAPVGPSTWSAHFMRGDFLFTLGIGPYSDRPSTAAITGPQLLEAAKHADVVRLADFWVRYPALMDDGYRHQSAVATDGPSPLEPTFVPSPTP